MNFNKKGKCHNLKATVRIFSENCPLSATVIFPYYSKLTFSKSVHHDTIVHGRKCTYDTVPLFITD